MQDPPAVILTMHHFVLGLGISLLLAAPPSSAAEPAQRCPLYHISLPPTASEGSASAEPRELSFVLEACAQRAELGVRPTTAAEERLRAAVSVAEQSGAETTPSRAHTLELLLRERGFVLTHNHARVVGLELFDARELDARRVLKLARYVPFGELRHAGEHAATALISVVPLAGSRRAEARALVAGEVADSALGAVTWLEDEGCAVLSGLGSDVGRWAQALSGGPLPSSCWTWKEATPPAHSIERVGDDYVFRIHGSRGSLCSRSMEEFLELVREASGLTFEYSAETRELLKHSLMNAGPTARVPEQHLVSYLQIASLRSGFRLLEVNTEAGRVLQVLPMTSYIDCSLPVRNDDLRTAVSFKLRGVSARELLPQLKPLCDDLGLDVERYDGSDGEVTLLLLGEYSRVLLLSRLVEAIDELEVERSAALSRPPTGSPLAPPRRE